MIEAIWILIIGAVLIGLGIYKKAGKFNTAALAIGALMVLGGAFMPGYGIWEGEMQLVPTAVGAGAELEITLASAVGAGGNLTATVDNDARTITLALDTLGTYGITANCGAVNFTIRPQATEAHDDNSLINVQYAADETMTFETDDIYTLSGSEYSCDWATYPDLATTSASVGTADSGTHTMKITDSDCLQWRYDFSEDAVNTLGANLRTVGESLSFPITISSGGNSYTFTVIVVCVSNS